MKSLPQVTLVAVDGTDNPSGTFASFQYSAAQMDFGSTCFIACEGFSCVVTARLDKDGYNRFCLRQLHKHIKTSYALTVQADSGINNAAAWDDAWLQYDYIGAAWPVGWGGSPYRVGNSGFCLRSQKLLRATAEIVKEDAIVWHNKRMNFCSDDVVTCMMYHRQLESLGLKFAPVEVAVKFAFEQPVPEATELKDQFGFHRHKKP